MRHLVVAALIVLPLVVASPASAEDTPAVSANACASSVECARGEVCIDRACRAAAGPTAPLAPAPALYRRPWFWAVVGGAAVVVAVVLGVGLGTFHDAPVNPYDLGSYVVRF